MKPLEWLVVVPIALIITVYICYVIVDAFTKATPGFGDTGWYIFGATVTAVVGFIGYRWLKGN